MRRIVVGILLALVLSVMPVVPVFAVDDDIKEVEVTAIPTYVAITNSVASWEIGAVKKESTKWWTADGNEPNPWPAEADDMKSTITNIGSVNVDISVEATDFTGGVLGWTLVTATPGAAQVILAVGKTGTTNKAAMLELEDADPQELVNNLPHTAENTIEWCMYLETGTFTDGVLKTSIVTLTAIEHP